MNGGEMHGYDETGKIIYPEITDAEFLDRFQERLDDEESEPDNEIEIYLPLAIFNRLIALARKGVAR